MFYLYRTTTEKLAEALDKIEASGDTIVKPEHVGGRDWIVICRRTGVAS